MKILNLNNKNIRFGGYQTIASVIVIAIAIAINVIFSGLNLKVDLTEEKFFSLSPKTEEVVRAVSDDITLYVLEETGTESAAFKEILVRYDKLNSHVSLVYKDPILYPQFTQKYIDDNTPKIDNGSIIVENNTTGKYKVLTQSDFYTSNGYGSSSTQSLAIENAVTSAISYVASNKEYTLYISTGHGELTLPKTLTSIFSKSNIATQNISLSTEDLGNPSTSTLIIYSPHTDFNDVELDKIIKFLDAGGKALIFTDYDTPELKNFTELLNYYGIKHSSGAIVEAMSSNMLSSYPTYLIPNYNDHDITSSLITNKLPLLIPLSSALTKADNVRTSVTITPLISTSDEAFLKTNLEGATTTKTADDISGPFDLACAIEDKNALNNENVITTRLVVFANSYFIDETKLNLSSTGNETFITNCLNWLQNDTLTSFEIAGKASNDYSLPAMSTTKFLIFSCIAVVIIPAVVLIIGIIVLLRRKNL